MIVYVGIVPTRTQEIVNTISFFVIEALPFLFSFSAASAFTSRLRSSSVFFYTHLTVNIILWYNHIVGKVSFAKRLERA